MSTQHVVGVIGGSGLYEMEGLIHIQEISVDTPFGKPSDVIVLGELDGVRMAFLPRHGRGHRITPSEINFRANICALKMLGCTEVISISAVGSMKEHIHPGDIVIVDQFIDRTRHRVSTFFGEGCVAHVSLADPVCAPLAAVMTEAAESLGTLKVHRKGTYLCMEGPQFSTRAESHLYRSWGVDVIGMTNMPEAKLAREAELSYATVALATDYDCWHETEEAVTVEAVIAILMQNVANAKQILRAAVSRLKAPLASPCKDALKYALITDRTKIPTETRQKLSFLLDRYLGS